MVKMILTVPHNFNAELFFSIVTDVVNNGRDGLDGAEKYEYSLGDKLNMRRSQTPYVEEYEIDASLIDFEVVEVIQKLQELCPLTEVHCESDGVPTAQKYWDDEYYYGTAYEGLFRNSKGF